jgi:hypothetical protein
MKKLTFALIIFSLSSCQLFEPKPESEKFYCKVNGKAWRPEKASYSLASPLSAEWDKKNERFKILAYNYPQYVWLSLKIDSNGLKIGEYNLSKDVNLSIGYHAYDYSVKNNEVLISKDGNVKITKIENNKVSGTFEFTTYSDTKKKDYKITKGQFNDLIY